VPARIFTAAEELPFAGHPVIGAAAALHERYAAPEPARSWVFVIAGREIAVRTRPARGYYEAEMKPGLPRSGCAARRAGRGPLRGRARAQPR